jgi:hypothetical protein
MNKILNIFGILAILVISASLISAYSFEYCVKSNFTEDPSFYYQVNGGFTDNQTWTDNLGWTVKNFSTDSAYIEGSYYQPIDDGFGVVPFAGYDFGSYNAGALVAKNIDDFTVLAGAETTWDADNLNWNEYTGAVGVAKYKVNDTFSVKSAYYVPNAQEIKNWDDGSLSVGLSYNFK